MKECEITPEEINFESDYKYKAALQSMSKIIHGHPNMDLTSEDVDVSLWLPEMNGANVTIFCDRLLERYDFEGFIFLITAKDDIDCLSVLNIGDQSSGFEIYKQESIEDKSMLIMRVNPSKIKKELKIPDDCRSGFTWGKHQPDRPIPSHSVPTSRYNSRYILNFSVSGEFDLGIYYLPYYGNDAICLLNKCFCCK